MKLLYNARIHTLNPAQQTASALLIDRGEILAVGGDELLDTRAEKFDLGGRVVLPGLTDAHIHLQHYALGLQKIDCETATLEECLRRVAERVKTAKDGEWILGHGWNQNEWGDLTARTPKRGEELVRDLAGFEVKIPGLTPPTSMPSPQTIPFTSPPNHCTPRGRTAPR